MSAVKRVGITLFLVIASALGMTGVAEAARFDNYVYLLSGNTVVGRYSESGLAGKVTSSATYCAGLLTYSQALNLAAKADAGYGKQWLCTSYGRTYYVADA